MAVRRKKKPTSKSTPKRKVAAKRPVRKPARKKVARKPVPKVAARNPLKAEKARLERNKQLVLTLYRHLIGEKNMEAARPYMGDRYIQHSPYATDGHEGVAEFIKGFKEQFPKHRYEVKKVIAEGDFVVLHLHGIDGLNPHGEAVVDIFRIEDGKVVEHWDVIQALPAESRNPNTPF